MRGHIMNFIFYTVHIGNLRGFDVYDIGVLYNTAVKAQNVDVFCGGMEPDRAGRPQKVVLEQPNNYLTPLENSYHSVNDLSFRKGR